MKMNAADIKAYPDCAKLLQEIRTRVTTKVLNAFFESCKAEYLNGVDPGHTDRVAHGALMWGQAPAVSVHAGELKVPELGKIVPACGFTDTFPGHPPFIIITHIWFDAFETCGETDRAKNAERLTRTVLHETVHWVRDAVGADEDITEGGFRGHPEEAGHFFETKAYGTSNICTEAEIKAAIATMRPNI
jgi:hypothetical protein